MNKRQIIVCILLAVASLPATAQQNKNEVNLVAGAAMMDMWPGDYGAAANVQYTRWFQDWFGAEARLGLVRYNNFPAVSNPMYDSPEGYPGWGITNGFDAYIRSLPVGEAMFAEWSSATFLAGEASLVVAPVRTTHHRLKLFGGVTRQHRAVTTMILTETTLSFTLPQDQLATADPSEYQVVELTDKDARISEYDLGYTIINISEWGRHFGIAYQYLLTSDWSVGATTKLTYMAFQVGRGHSDHVLFGLSVGKSF
ncbi:MAG: hypothetical protein WA958_22010 [Tunicatimonas sp.]